MQYSNSLHVTGFAIKHKLLSAQDYAVKIFAYKHEECQASETPLKNRN